MKLEIVESPEPSLIDFFDKKIEEFNLARWEVKTKVPLAVKVMDPNGEIMAGASAKTFGLWMMLENLWVHETLRGQNMGTKILLSLEDVARKRGCKFVLLDTLNFQAKDFYEKQGYKVQWTQLNYPREGSKHFMVKELS